MDPNKVMAKAAKKLFTDMDSKGEPFAPYNFVSMLRQVFPQFNETDNHGHHKQQDAEEAYSQIVSSWKSVLKDENEENFIDKIFGLELHNKLMNIENPDEPPQESDESAIKLSCHIGEQQKAIDHLLEGLKVSLESEVEKFSPSLGRNALYKKIQ